MNEVYGPSDGKVKVPGCSWFANMVLDKFYSVDALGLFWAIEVIVPNKRFSTNESSFVKRIITGPLW